MGSLSWPSTPAASPAERIERLCLTDVRLLRSEVLPFARLLPAGFFLDFVAIMNYDFFEDFRPPFFRLLSPTFFPPFLEVLRFSFLPLPVSLFLPPPDSCLPWPRRGLSLPYSIHRDLRSLPRCVSAPCFCLSLYEPLSPLGISTLSSANDHLLDLCKY